jgi:hypothetical protein
MLELLVGIPIIILFILEFIVIFDFIHEIMGLCLLFMWLFFAYKIGESVLS